VLIIDLIVFRLVLMF